MTEQTSTTSPPSLGQVWLRRWLIGLIAGMIALGGAAQAWAPSASAQVNPGADVAGKVTEGAISAVLEKSPELLDALCGEDNALACGSKLLSQGIDFGECVAEGTGTGGTGTQPATPTGDPNAGDTSGTAPPTEGAGANTALQDCIKKALEKNVKKDQENQDKEKKEAPDFSLYRLGSALTSAYVNSLVPGGQKDVGNADNADSADSTTGGDTGTTGGDSGNKKETTDVTKKWQTVLQAPGMAGGAVARPDDTKAEDTKWLLGVGDGVNDARYSYDSFYTNNEKEQPDRGVGQYVVYGAALNSLGLDSTAPKNGPGSISGSSMAAIMLGAYMGAGAIDTVFDAVVTVLQNLNPFYWLHDAVTGSRDIGNGSAMTDARFTQGMQGTNQDNTALGDLQNFIADIYNGAVNLGWYVTIPVFVGVTVIGLLLFRRTNHSRNVKQLIIRMAFLVIGVPLLGVTYTGALGSLQGLSGDAGGSNATKVVLNTYTDFDSWMMHGRLRPPDQGTGAVIEWDMGTRAASESSAASARRTAYLINTESNGAWSDLRNQAGSGQNNTDANFMGSVTEQGGQSSSGDVNKMYSGTIDLLNRAMKHETVSGSNFESQVKGALTALPKSYKNPDQQKAADKIVRGWVEDYNSADKLSKMPQAKIDNERNPLFFVADRAGMTTDDSILSQQNRGGGSRIVRFKPGDGNAQACTANRVITSWVPDTNTQPGWNPDVDAKKDTSKEGEGNARQNLAAVCNMSPLTAYNYLNTTFDANSATVYSPSGSSSAFVRDQHASATLVGSGLTSFVYWLSSMALLLSFVLIGLFYALGMLINTIKRGIQLITSVPFAVIGLLPAIAKTIVYTIIMFLEIFVTLFLYKMVQSFLMLLPGLLEKPIMNVSNGSDKTGFGATMLGQVPLAQDHPILSVLLVTVVGTVLVIAFTIMAISMRSSVIQALDEGATRLVNKLTDTQVSGGSDSGPGALRQGLTRGAGMAAAHKILSPSDGGDEADAAGAAAGPDGANPYAGAGLGAVGGGLAGAGAANAVDDDDQSGITDMNGGTQMQTVSDEDQVDPTQLPPGQDYQTDDNGDLVDANGNPITDVNGDNVNVSDITANNADGDLVDSAGNPIAGPDGQPLTTNDVYGVNRDGNLVGNDGATLMDANGQPISAQNASNPLSAYGSAAGAAGVGAAAGGVAADRELASSVASQGGLSDYSAGGNTMEAMASGTDGSDIMPASYNDSFVGDGNVDTMGQPMGMTSPAAAGGMGAAAGAAAMAAGKHGFTRAAESGGMSAADSSRAVSAATEGVREVGTTMREGASELRSMAQGATHAGASAAGAAPGIAGVAGAAGAPSAGGSQPAGYNPAAAHNPAIQNVSMTGAMPSQGQGPSVGSYLAAGVAGAAVQRAAGGLGRNKTVHESISGGRGPAPQQGGGGGAAGKPGRNGRIGGMTTPMMMAGTQAAQQSQSRKRRHGEHDHEHNDNNRTGSRRMPGQTDQLHRNPSTGSTPTGTRMQGGDPRDPFGTNGGGTMNT